MTMSDDRRETEQEPIAVEEDCNVAARQLSHWVLSAGTREGKSHLRRLIEAQAHATRRVPGFRPLAPCL